MALGDGKESVLWVPFEFGLSLSLEMASDL